METELEKIKSLRRVTRSHNPSSRKEIMCVKYENVLKAVDKHLMELILKDSNKKEFEPIVDYDKVTVDNFTLMTKRHKNILLDIAKELPIGDELDVLRKNMIDRYLDFYIKCEALPLVDIIGDLLDQKNFIQELIVWHPTVDHRVTIDINDLFGTDNRVNVVFGSREEVIKNRTDITTLITDDAEDISYLLEVDNIKYMEIMVATFLHNYDIDGDFILDMEAIMKNNLCKIATFVPYALQLEEKENKE